MTPSLLASFGDVAGDTVGRTALWKLEEGLENLPHKYGKAWMVEAEKGEGHEAIMQQGRG